MNNKGFAITGVLYTLLVLFLLIMLSILEGLKYRNDYLQKSTDSIADDFLGQLVSEKDMDNDSYIGRPINNFNTSYDGKYIFSHYDSEKKVWGQAKCPVYLKKGEQITNVNTIVFSRIDENSNCNNFTSAAKEALVLEKYYKFDY